MLRLQNISYTHPNKDLLFDSIDLTVNKHDKIALIGNNGAGKSTLLKIIAGQCQPSAGNMTVLAQPYDVPQHFGQYNDLTVGQALQVERKLTALREIENGNATEENYALLDDDWTIEERCHQALRNWQLTDLDLQQKMGTLSGGQKTKLFLAGISIHQPELILLDEPSNHLDYLSRQVLYDLLQSTPSTLIVVSHDRKLVNLFGKVCELSKHGIAVYGGNYEFYLQQKQAENLALNQNIQSKEKTLRKAREKERQTIERQQKLDSRGKSKQEKAGVARIMMNTLRNNAENSTAKMKTVHAEKIDGISQDLQELRAALPDIAKMKFGFDDSALHRGKILVTATNLNFRYGTQPLWPDSLNFQITSGERIVLKGANGSGKTTLVKLILGNLENHIGTIYRADSQSVYVDQDYSLIDKRLKMYEQVQKFNASALQEHEVKNRLSRFLFTKDDWDKPCSALSGGERMRLLLCCLTVYQQSPDLIILDEPTNNLDIQNIEILTAAINEYRGTLLVVSHDERFLEEVHIDRTIQL